MKRGTILNTLMYLLSLSLLIAAPAVLGAAPPGGPSGASGVDRPGQGGKVRPHVDDDEDDADMPPFLRGKMSRGEYLRLRETYNARLRGLPYDLPYDPRAKAIREMARQESGRAELVASPTWSPLGPAPIPNGQALNTGGGPVSGRVTCIAVKPSDANVVYVGTAQGGLYRTLDGGATWTALTDSALSLAIGAVAIDPVTPTTVWVGTGEGNNSLDSFFGVGLYRITNADTNPVLEGPFETRVAGTGTTAGNGHAFYGNAITCLAFDPNNADRLFVGCTHGFSGVSGFFPPPNQADPGLYFTAAAHAATPTFSKVSDVPCSATPTDWTSGVEDAVFEPGSSDHLLVGVKTIGVMRSTNASTASQSPSTSPSFTTVASYPYGVMEKLAINKVGSTVTAVAALDTGSGGVVLKSTDGGATWPTNITSAGFCGGQCWYDIALAMDPGNASQLYLAGVGYPGTFAYSSDGGSTWHKTDTGLHVDAHALAVAPSLTGTVYYGSDGGIYVSTDSGKTWTSLNNMDFSATQFESVAVHPSDPKILIGGTQDNGTNLRRSDGSWTMTMGGDGGATLIDPSNGSRMYHTFYDLSPQYTADGGNNWYDMGVASDGSLFYPPMALGQPGSPTPVYIGGMHLQRSGDGVNFSSASQTLPAAISAIGVSAQNDAVRIVGLSNGGIYYTTSGSSTLTHVTQAGMPSAYVARVAVDPTNANTAYVTYDNYGLADGAHVWKTTNLNGAPAAWAASGFGIPDVPVNAFAIDPAHPLILYAGTDIGVYVSLDGGATWNPYGTGMPRVAVFDLAYQAANGVLRAATHGRGIWEIAGACQSPGITATPSDASVCAGGTATFTAAASGNPAPTVQWQVSADGGASWTDVPGAASTTLTFTTAAGENGNEYQAVFMNTCGTAVSAAATLTVNEGPAITLQPASQTVTRGSSAMFTAGASGTPSPSVQWQESADGGSTWSDIPAATSATLTFTASLSQSGYQYRAVFTNGCGAASSGDAVLTVVCPAIGLAPASLPGMVKGTPYSQTLSASNTIGGTAYALTGGALPPGLTLSSGGQLSGTCAVLGSYTFTVTATDGTGCQGSQQYTLGVFSALFADDYGRSQFCGDFVSGQFSWNVLTGAAAGQNFYGTGSVLNGGARMTNAPGSPFTFSIVYDPVRRKASGWLITPGKVYVALADTNTANNTGGCF